MNFARCIFFRIPPSPDLRILLPLGSGFLCVCGWDVSKPGIFLPNALSIFAYWQQEKEKKKIFYVTFSPVAKSMDSIHAGMLQVHPGNLDASPGWSTMWVVFIVESIILPLPVPYI